MILSAERHTYILLGFLVEQKYTPSMLDDMSNLEWELVASNCGVPVPNTGTRLMLQARLAEVTA